MMQRTAIRFWRSLGPRLLPFADAASPDLPLSRLLRLALFQVSVGMAVVLLNGILNRVMVVELGIGASLVSAMVAIPILFAPFRALVGQTPISYLATWRMQRAAYLLEMGTLSIAEIAARVGYASELAFAKAFRRLIGTPPGAYARRHARGRVAIERTR